MPAIWSSSERPISVRTVWVDGIRHAILSPDDPLINQKLRRCSRRSRSKSYSTEYQQLESRLERLNSCFMNLRMVVSDNLSEKKAPPHMYRKLSAPICPRLLTGTSNVSTLESPSNIERRIERKCRDHLVSKEDDDALIDRPALKQKSREEESETDSKAECKKFEGSSDTFWNPLFERVLQWLDLSGRAQSYDFEEDFVERSSSEEERKWSPAKKRSLCPKHECFEQKERITTKNYKLHKERNLGCAKKEETKMLHHRLPKIKNIRERHRENYGTSTDSLLCSPGGKMPLKLSEKQMKSEIKAQEKGSTVWSPSGRLKLHIVIPNINSKESQMSSQESLSNH